MDSLPHLYEVRNYADLTALKDDILGRAFAHPDELDLLDLEVPPHLLDAALDLYDHVCDYHPAGVALEVIAACIDEAPSVVFDGAPGLLDPALDEPIRSFAAQVLECRVVRLGRKAVAG